MTTEEEADMRHSARGFTVPELVLALSIMAVIGLSVAGVTGAISTAWANSESTYDTIQTGRSAMLNLQQQLSRAKLITKAASNAVVFWARDFNGDGKINLSELAVIEHDPASKTIKRYRIEFSDNLDEATRASLDTEIPLDVMTRETEAKTTIMGDYRVAKKLVAEDISTFEVAAYPDSPEATLVSLRIVVGEGDDAMELRSATALRADETEYVKVDEDNGEWYVDPDAVTTSEGKLVRNPKCNDPSHDHYLTYVYE